MINERVAGWRVCVQYVFVCRLGFSPQKMKMHIKCGNHARFIHVNVSILLAKRRINSQLTHFCAKLHIHNMPGHTSVYSTMETIYYSQLLMPLLHNCHRPVCYNGIFWSEATTIDYSSVSVSFIPGGAISTTKFST